jgi:hypothetical protein
MEVRILLRQKPGEPIPRSVPMRLLEVGEPWIDAPELGTVLAEILDQDVSNVEELHRGLKSSKTGKVQLGDYQEIRIRQFHQTLDKYLSGETG